MKRSLLTLVALLSLSGAILAGCGSSSKTNSTPAPATSTPATPSASSGSGSDVTMQNTAFAPGSLTVKVGQKITWTNQDGFDHNVTAKSGASFNSGNFGQGGTFSFTPKKAGTINYSCTIHPGMDGKIVVTQ